MEYKNPIITGFHPDPSICRVGEDYYLVTSSFEYFPAIPIFHSRDLLNWKQIGNVISKKSQLDFDNVGDSGGIWAPTIRYFKGIFYVTATFSEKGNFIVSTENIAGPWSNPIFIDIGGIDPSLYFEGEKAYYCTNYSNQSDSERISLVEINMKTGALKEAPKVISYGNKGGFLEAPHIYKRDKYYYLITAEGGTFANHMVNVARSSYLYGPYENYSENPILTNRNDTTMDIQDSGHGDLIEDTKGNWWMVHLGIRLCRRTMTNLGRETFLTPIKWDKEWPTVIKKKAKLIDEGPLAIAKHPEKKLCFDFLKEPDQSQLITIGNGYEESIKYNQGYLTLVSDPELNEYPVFLGVRQRDFECIVETGLLFNPEADNDSAGLTIRLTSEFYYTFVKRRIKGKNFLVVGKNAEDFTQIIYKDAILDGEVRLKIKSNKEKYEFYFATNEGEFQYLCAASTRFLCPEIVGKCFTGTVIGMSVLGGRKKEIAADFLYFSIY